MRLSHRKYSAWYRQLAQQLEAGLPFASAVRSSRGTGVSAARLEAIAGKVETGGTVDDALRTATAWLPRSDLLALSAAAGAGRMPRTLHHLSAHHAELAAAKFKVILACAYPLAILHFGLLLLPLMRMIDWEKGFQWNAFVYGRGVLMGILPLWIAAFVLWILARRDSPLLSRLARLLPVLGRYSRAQELADFSFALANLLEAGVPLGPAWTAAGQVARSPQLQKAAAAMAAVVATRAAPGEKLSAWSCFPAEFVALYHTGEQTGQLDANLHRLAAQNQEAANRALAIVTLLYPTLIFLSVAGAVVYHVVSIYSGYLKMLVRMSE